MLTDNLKVGAMSAFSSIRRGNKKTTIFIIFVLALIFLNLVFLPSLTEGMVEVFAGSVRYYAYGDIIVEPSGENTYISNTNLVLSKIRALNGVDGAAKRLEGGGSIKYKQDVVGVNIIGLIPSDEHGVSNYPNIVREGEFLGDLSRDEILIGSIIAARSPASQVYDHLEDVDVGSIVNVTYSNGVQRSYKIKGIHEGGSEITDLNAIVHFAELEDVLNLTGDQKSSSVIVNIHEEGAEPQIKNKILNVGVKEDVFTWQEKAEALIRQALQSIGALGTMSTVVSLIVGAALIFIIIYINTLNRKREIGILKAIGISPASIVISYIFISIFYVSLGIIAGMVLFFSIVLYFQSNPLVFFETFEVVPKVNITLLIQSILTMFCLALVAGFLPAWVVARQDILKAIWGN